MLRLLQTGRVQQYVFLIVAGMVVLVAGFISLLIGGNEYT